MWEPGALLLPPTPISFPSPWPTPPAYPADEGGIGEGGPHVVELEVVHVVEEFCRGLGRIRSCPGAPHSLFHPPCYKERLPS